MKIRRSRTGHLVLRYLQILQYSLKKTEKAQRRTEGGRTTSGCKNNEKKRGKQLQKMKVTIEDLTT